MTPIQLHSLCLYLRLRLTATVLTLRAMWKRTGLVNSITRPLKTSLGAESPI